MLVRTTPAIPSMLLVTNKRVLDAHSHLGRFTDK